MWEINDQQATWKGRVASAVVDVRDPKSGVELSDSAPVEAAPQLQPFCLGVANAGDWQLLDQYLRGRDLVVSYSHTGLKDVKVTAYYRVHELANSLAVELILSVETSVLDSFPTLQLSTDLHGAADIEAYGTTGDEASLGPLTMDAGVSTWGFTGVVGDDTYAEFLHPVDVGHCQPELQAADNARSCYRLFAEPLEKGVIRRVRLCAILSRDRNELDGFAETFNYSRPPLTA